MNNYKIIKTLRDGWFCVIYNGLSGDIVSGMFSTEEKAKEWLKQMSL